MTSLSKHPRLEELENDSLHNISKKCNLMIHEKSVKVDLLNYFTKATLFLPCSHCLCPLQFPCMLLSWGLYLVLQYILKKRYGF